MAKLYELVRRRHGALGELPGGACRTLWKSQQQQSGGHHMSSAILMTSGGLVATVHRPPPPVGECGQQDNLAKD
jgi:hypothetical protein